MKTIGLIWTLFFAAFASAEPNPRIDFQKRLITIDNEEIAKIEVDDGWSVRDEGDGHLTIWKHDESFYLLLMPISKIEKGSENLENFCKDARKPEDLLPIPKVKFKVYGQVMEKKGSYFVSGCTDFHGHSVVVNFPNSSVKKPSVSDDAAKSFGFIKDVVQKNNTHSKPTTYELSLSNSRSILTLDIPGFEVQSEKSRPDGSGSMVLAVNEGQGVTVSAFIERNKNINSSKDCLEIYWKKTLASPLPKSGVKTRTENNKSFGEFIMEEYNGKRYDMKNIHAYMGENDICVDIHISKGNYKDDDDVIFKKIFNSAKLKTK